MSKDPAFLFYDGDAARDVSHMNRLERGAYFDLIQAQRKFGGFTTDQARKILGKDFSDCWDAISLVLSTDENGFFIEWVRDSINKRKEHAEKQRNRIQQYWDKKKETDIPKQNDGNTVVLPLENESENVNEIVIDYKGIIENYNTLCPKLSKVEVLSDQRKGHIKARVTEFGQSKVIEVIRRAGESDFLNGKNNTAWKANFDWIMKPTNFIKIMEGNFQNKEEQPEKKVTPLMQYYRDLAEGKHD